MKNHIDLKTTRNFVAAVIIPMLFVTVAYADNISSSQLGTGLKNLLNDASTYVVVLTPIVGGLAAVYFVIRRSMADEQDGKMWEKRIKTAIICGILGALVGGIIKLIASYFGN